MLTALSLNNFKKKNFGLLPNFSSNIKDRQNVIDKFGGAAYTQVQLIHESLQYFCHTQITCL